MFTKGELDECEEQREDGGRADRDYEPEEVLSMRGPDGAVGRGSHGQDDGSGGDDNDRVNGRGREPVSGECEREHGVEGELSGAKQGVGRHRQVAHP